MTELRDEPLPDETVLRAQRGELAAFEAVVRRFEQPLRAWVAAHCPPGADADEVAQKTFLAAFNRLGEFQIGTSFAAWLFTIARYQLMTEVTRLRRLADYHARFAPDLIERELERRTLEMEEVTAVRLQHLRACLDAMGEPGRRFIHWRYTDEIPLQEMAERTGRSVPAIKKQLWLLRQKLQECIDGKLAAEAGGAV
ncbi:MAG: sigma-70 family RNA polymerase sigma factor [Verrucomicrobia bacterium]|nr:sigma-70 family RNA polymerase sigma factor [Verrucomicrobiota bacterium]